MSSCELLLHRWKLCKITISIDILNASMWKLFSFSAVILLSGAHAASGHRASFLEGSLPSLRHWDDSRLATVNLGRVRPSQRFFYVTSWLMNFIVCELYGQLVNKIHFMHPGKITSIKVMNCQQKSKYAPVNFFQCHLNELALVLRRPCWWLSLPTCCIYSYLNCIIGDLYANVH